MSNNTISSDVNNVICEAVGCFAKAKFKVPINVGTKGTISLYLCEDCKPRFCSDENNHGKNGQALDLVGGLGANAIQNTKSSSQEPVQRK
jgi:hypothetical protein